MMELWQKNERLQSTWLHPIMQRLCGLLVLLLSFQPSPYKYKGVRKAEPSAKIVAKQASYLQPTKE